MGDCVGKDNLYTFLPVLPDNALCGIPRKGVTVKFLRNRLFYGILALQAIIMGISVSMNISWRGMTAKKTLPSLKMNMGQAAVTVIYLVLRDKILMQHFHTVLHWVFCFLCA